jgi:hypothetical protein
MKMEKKKAEKQKRINQSSIKYSQDMEKAMLSIPLSRKIKT